eukprot:5262354-Amphidinium_carterae.1
MENVCGCPSVGGMTWARWLAVGQSSCRSLISKSRSCERAHINSWSGRDEQPNNEGYNVQVTVQQKS